MSGAKFLLDTNIILGILKESEAALKLVESVPFEACCYSAITRMELLGFPGILEEEVAQIQGMLSCLTNFPLDRPIEDKVIEIRQQHKFKLPDAIIAATALVNGARLITLDQKLDRIYKDLSVAENLN